MTSTMSKEERAIRNYLSMLKLDEELSGHFYLVEIILYQLQHPSPFIKEAKEVVSKKYGVTKECLNNSIRYALKDTGLNCKSVVVSCVREVRS